MGSTLGAGLSPTQVINTLINSSTHIIIKTMRRKWWGWNILMEFARLKLAALSLMVEGKRVRGGQITEFLD